MADDDTLPLTADQLEEVFHEAVGAGGTGTVEACLRLLLVVDPRRAIRLHDELKTALAVAAMIQGGGRG